MIDLQATIIPGHSVAGLNIGQDIRELLKNNNQFKVRPLRNNIAIYESGPVLIWVNDGIIFQIGVLKGYQGTTSQGIKISSTLGDVKQHMGELDEDEEDKLVVVGVPGLCFETEEWGPGIGIKGNLSSRITEIYVYAESK